MINEVDVEKIKNAMDLYLNDSQLSKDDKMIVQKWMAELVLILHMTQMPIFHSKYPEALRLLAAVLDIMRTK